MLLKRNERRTDAETEEGAEARGPGILTESVHSGLPVGQGWPGRD